MMRRSKDVHKCGMEVHHHDPPSSEMAKRLFVAYLWLNCTSPLSLSLDLGFGSG